MAYKGLLESWRGVFLLLALQWLAVLAFATRVDAQVAPLQGPRVGGYLQVSETFASHVGMTGTLNRVRLSVDGSGAVLSAGLGDGRRTQA